MLWGSAVFFNTSEYIGLHGSFRIFSGRVRRQNLKLQTVEVAFDYRSHQVLEEGSDLMLRIRTISHLLHKELMLNLALGALPQDCTSGRWVGKQFQSVSAWPEKCRHRYLMSEPRSDGR